ncbi:MAG: DNA polymerase I, partial [uncultured Pseudonocardia sp.]
GPDLPAGPARRRGPGRRPRPRPVHPQLRRAGHGGGVGARAAGRAARRPLGRPRGAGVLPARRGRAALSRVVGRRRRGGRAARRGRRRAPALRRHPGPLPAHRAGGAGLRRAL